MSDKLIAFFNNLSNAVGLREVPWYITADKTLLRCDIDQNVVQNNKPKTPDEILKLVGKALYEKFSFYHPLMDIPKATGKHYEIKRNRDDSFSILIKIDALKARVSEIQKEKKNTEIDSKSPITFEELELAKEYLNGPNKLGHGIEGLTEDSYVLSIVPAKNDPENCEIKIKSHYVRLGRTQAIESNVTVMLSPVRKIKKFAQEQKKINAS
ncbi:MAG: hypothetical protein ABIH77_05615 [Pseudomonadota bacterium]|nr:hypothetical protein [Gammaproteobacteria bacterium]MBU1558837.1 hypothetical protein [Gammaproteobacteria bacterium]MBU1926520.1 hypothetical protein [Gammaproteobacteria bacterium]MBU2545574.1 hypothetical protein [Gammaproteobacteria bacterium]